MTIGERVRRRPDPKQQIIGSTWFYYGARYGEYLSRAGEANARDYLPASVEAAPGNPNAYFDLGDFYEENGHASQAIENYQAVLELDANRGEAENAIARVLWHDNRHDDAVTHWHAALAAFDRVENRGVRVPEGFWSGVSATFEEIGHARQISTLRPDIEKLLRGYVNINGEYRSQELMGAAVHACFESGANCDWALELSDDLAWWYESGEVHLTAEQEEEIARRSIAIAVLRSTEVAGENRDRAEVEVLNKRFRYIGLLLDHGKYKEAQQAWDALSRDQREKPGTARTIELKLAAVNGVVPQLLARYQSAPTTAPFVYELEQTADYLRKRDHQDAAARAILEFVYQSALDRQELLAANFLGLARVYLEQGHTDLAVRLLRRMNLVSGEQFETFVPAATVLAEHGRTAEAIPFLRDRLKAAPWDDEARLQLARLLSGDEQRAVALQLVHDGDAIYRNRSAAALMAVDPSADVKTELGLLQRGAITPAEASKPFYVEARRVAGLFRDALAIRPSDSEIRLQTLRAALAAAQDSLVMALAPQMVRAEPYMYREEYREEPFLARSGLTPREKAGIARDVAQAYEREGDLASAIRYDQIAVTLGLDLGAKVKQLEAEQKRDQENALRAPNIHDRLEQDRVVKPRRTT